MIDDVFRIEGIIMDYIMNNSDIKDERVYKLLKLVVKVWCEGWEFDWNNGN